MSVIKLHEYGNLIDTASFNGPCNNNSHTLA